MIKNSLIIILIFLSLTSFSASIEELPQDVIDYLVWEILDENDAETLLRTSKIFHPKDIDSINALIEKGNTSKILSKKYLFLATQKGVSSVEQEGLIKDFFIHDPNYYNSKMVKLRSKQDAEKIKLIKSIVLPTSLMAMVTAGLAWAYLPADIALVKIIVTGGAIILPVCLTEKIWFDKK